MMAKVTTAERVSTDPSDNYVFQRSLLAYRHAANMVHGDVLEIGTGTGYGIKWLAPKSKRFITIDKDMPEALCQHAKSEFYQMEVPPIDFDNNSFDYVVAFQVIEHIEDDMQFVREVARVLRPEGKFIVTTPNAPVSLTRNPWHVREYNADELRNLLECNFSRVEAFGVVGNDKVMEYYAKNRRSVERIARFDIFDLQHRLPRKLLQKPYDMLNRWNRKRLLRDNAKLTTSITCSDYAIEPYREGCFDLFFVATK
ncbi:MAG: class I SAM-dependent methyltransferase [Alistipes sp.]